MKVLKTTIFLLLSMFASEYSYAQDVHLSSRKGESSFGLGLGLPYGAMGIRMGINVTDLLNLFGGLGYQLSGVGYNIGVRKDFRSANSTSLAQMYVVGMYGTNAAIKVKGLSQYNEVYTGGTFGFGVKVNSRMIEGNFWDMGLLVPLRSSAFKDDENQVKNDPRISEFSAAWPVLIVIGYNFNL